MLKHIEAVCDSSFWLANFVYSKNPDFTSCFQHTVIQWAPCFVFWAVLPFWVYMLTRPRKCEIRVSWVLVSKTVLTSLLIVSQIAMFVESILQKREALVYKMTPILLTLTYSAVLAVSIHERRRGLKSSAFLVTFWLFTFMSSLILLRSAVLSLISMNQVNATVIQRTAIIQCISCVIVVVELMLSCITERCFHKEQEMCKAKTSAISKFIFWSANTLVYTGYKRPLNKDDFDEPGESDTNSECTRKVLNEWNKLVVKYKASATSENETEANLKFLPVKNACKAKKPSFGWALIRAFHRKFIAASMMELTAKLLAFLGPVFLNKMINFVKDKDQTLFAGYFFALTMFLFGLLQMFLINHFMFQLLTITYRVNSACMGVIYRKSMRLSSAARQSSTTGEMLNLMSESTQVFKECLMFINLVWTAPLQIAICIFLLWKYLGVASLAGLVTMITLVPISAFISNRCKSLHQQRFKLQDLRIKITNEALSTIKIVKLYAWEKSFEEKIRKIKSDEIKILFKIGVLNAISNFCAISIPFMVAAVSFTTFLLTDEANVLDSNTAFVSLSLFNIMKFPLTNLPHAISSIIQTRVHLKRLQRFLLRDEVDEASITHVSQGEIVVSIKNATFGWDSDDSENAQLKDLDFQVATGKLVAVVGSIGCGKSSLLSALLGEMHKYNGTVNLYGKVAYVPQVPWIQNATFKDNILFGDKFDRDLYQKCIDACALTQDLTLFEAKDATEIGEKGVNLSGGQKSRINLARSVYSNADVYLLDDPLSAVDFNVSEHIFKNVIGPKGLLKNKTRLFVTNSIHFLNNVDQVIMIDNGRIAEIGKYEELIAKKAALWRFINKNEEHDSERPKFRKVSTNCSEDSHCEPDFVVKNQAMENFDEYSEEEEAEGGEGKLIMEEHVQVGKVKMNVLLSYFKACKPWLAALFLLFYLLANISQIASNLWLSDWSNDFRQGIDSKSKRNIRLVVFTCIGLGQGLFTLIGDLVNIKMSLTASDYFHTSLLKSMLQTTLEFFERTPIGRIINRFNRDIDAIERLIPDSFKPFVAAALSIISAILVIVIMLPWFAIPTAILLVLYFICQRFFVATTRQLRRIESTSKSPIYSNFTETLNGMSTIRAYKKEKQFVSKMNKYIDQNIMYFHANILCNRWLAIRLEVCGNIFTLFVCVFAILSRNTISPGITGMLITLALSVTSTVISIVRMAADFESNITSIERINEYQMTPHEEPWEIQDQKPRSRWPESGVIKFVNYSVRYRKDTGYALNDINFEIKSGEKIGIVGRTGAGKSSLTLALFRLLKNFEGGIHIDGVDIHSIGLHDLRKKLTIIPQDPVIYSGTLKMNIDPFGEYSDEEIWRALEEADMKAFVAGLEKQLLFECAEGGDNLSVGQRQLICLVRAILRKSKILILDEATASVDHNTDEHIQKTIRKAFHDCTILTIAHRINTIMDNDRIMVLDKGKIAEFDSVGNLLSNTQSRFYSLSNGEH